MAVSSHNGFGVFEALSTLARMSVLFMAQEQDGSETSSLPTDTHTSNNNSQNADHMNAQMLQAKRRGSSGKNIKLDKKKHLKPAADNGCCTGPSGKCSC